MVRKLNLSKELFKITRPEIRAEPPVRAKSSPKAVIPVIPKPGEPLAFCTACQAWQPMRWRLPAERGKRCETWFQCAVCGCEELKIRYKSQSGS
jgi:hypothetical protein